MSLFKKKIRARAVGAAGPADTYQANSGLISSKDALRMFARDVDLRVGNTDLIPDSMPDLEEERRAARRRAIARRRGRMSTILTAGTGPAPEPLGG
jgi:hypothetical protein